jgi:hypothetical protein
MHNPPGMAKSETLTEVLARSQVQMLAIGQSGSSVGRTIPYWETYRESAASTPESPAERIQRVATEADSAA